MAVENSFGDLHASHYDLIYADKPYDTEAAFVADLLGRRDGSLLDLACGTGRHAVEFARIGFDVTGIDYNPDLLDHARANAERAGVSLRTEAADMREVELGERFDAVTCLFDSIGYPCTDEGVAAALSRAREHLAPGAPLAVEFLHAPAMLAGADPVRVKRWETDGGGQLIRISETGLDRERDLMEVGYELIELRPDGDYLRAAETQRNRFFTVDGMRILMEAAGLAPERFVPAYATEGQIDESVWHVLGLAREAGR